jgi:hypothetical protein
MGRKVSPVYIRRFSAPPDVIYWHPRTPEHGDCVVAALSLATGVTYESALAACVRVQSDVLRKGMSWPETKKAAKLLGYSCITKRTGSFELDDSTGLLHVYVPGSRAASSHAVYLWEGRVIEPMYARTQLWLDCSAFLTHYKYSAGSLMIVTAMEGV